MCDLSLIIVIDITVWCCRHGTAIARAHLVHLLNAEQCQAANDLWTKPWLKPLFRVYIHYYFITTQLRNRYLF